MSVAAGFETLLVQGARLYASGQSAAAARVYRRALELRPGDPTARLRLALSVWHGENRAEDALSEIRGLALSYPQAAVFGAEALVLGSLGRFAETAEAARRAVTADPLHSQAWLDLARHDPAPGALFPEIAAVLARPDCLPAQRRDLHFALAEVWRRTGDHDAAFTETEHAHAACPPRWNATRERAGIAELETVFTPEGMAAGARGGIAGPGAVFIVGMPRSGTTLLERMLAAHPAIASAGETPLVGNLWAQYRKTMPVGIPGGAHLDAMGGALLRALRNRAQSALPRVIDKMPANHLFVPLIRLMLPDCTIIHMRRHPLDTCLSCHETSFAYGMEFAARQDTLGAAYLMYHRLMAHWTGPVGVAVETVVYEDLVTDPEAVLRPLLGRMGLDWAPDCRTPAPGGVIKTASAGQARGAVRTGSVGRWTRHRARLAPLIGALGGMEAIEAMHRG